MAVTKIGVIGLWHLGSVYAACLAELGHQVTGFEDDTTALANFKEGHAPLFEPGLDDLLKKNIEAQRLQFTDDFGQLADKDFIFVAFDTPVDEHDQSDLSGIIATIKKIAEIKKSSVTIVVSSQVPVGTCDQFVTMVKDINPSLEFDLVYMPENLRLGDALNVFLKADRFVVGSNNPGVYGKMEALLSGTNAPLVKVGLKSAETAKHALNSFLATSVSFINELADFCELVGADVTQVGEALKSDIRIGRKAFLSAGLGFAGGTLARDLITLTDIGHKSGLDLPVIEGVLKTNANRVERAVDKVIKLVKPIGPDTTVGVLGLTYKPGTSTLRRSVSLEIIRRLRELNIKVKAYDPKADLSEISKLDFTVANSFKELAEGANALLLVTGWPEFKDLDYGSVLDFMDKPVIIDLINFASTESRERATALGFHYYGTGIGELHHETKE